MTAFHSALITSALCLKLVKTRLQSVSNSVRFVRGHICSQVNAVADVTQRRCDSAPTIIT